MYICHNKSLRHCGLAFNALEHNLEQGLKAEVVFVAAARQLTASRHRVLH